MVDYYGLPSIWNFNFVTNSSLEKQENTLPLFFRPLS